MAAAVTYRIVPIDGFASGRAILFHGKEAGLFAWNRENEKVQMMLKLQPMCEEDAIGITAYVIHTIISLSHPAYIEVKKVSKRERRALAANLFFPKGKGMQWMKEPWQTKCDSAIFDPYGFLISQGRMQNLPFGRYTTSEKGCGWIAAYNLCKACGKEQFMQETAEGLAKTNLFHERFGENFFLIQYFLKQKGIVSKWYLGSNGMIAKKMAESGAGILLYGHSAGTHYAFYINLGNGSYHFYNDIYGKRNDIVTADAFFARGSVLPLAGILYVRKKDVPYARFFQECDAK
ncbi:MAG: hypothetical protein SOI44_08155 [Lactimicrobium sp.]|jgi:hypothetical protein|uniref:hypothetical protein n=1 Tax=Lactimicrobium sp. TaxID=2563780 RepID=UPI002F34F012